MIDDVLAGGDRWRHVAGVMSGTYWWLVNGNRRATPQEETLTAVPHELVSNCPIHRPQPQDTKPMTAETVDRDDLISRKKLRWAIEALRWSVTGGGTRIQGAFDKQDVLAVIDAAPAALPAATPETARVEATENDLKAELDAVLADWNALVAASGAKTNGSAIGHVAALAADAARWRAVREAMQIKTHMGGAGATLRSIPWSSTDSPTPDEYADALIAQGGEQQPPPPHPDTARLAEAERSLRYIAKAPCLTELLGERPEDNGGCGCMGCEARAYFAAFPSQDAWKENERRLEVDNAELNADAARLEAENSKLRDAVHCATSTLYEVAQDYNHPRFTDRHGTAERVNAAYAQCRAVFDVASPAPHADVVV